MKKAKRSHRKRILSALIAAGLGFSAWLFGGLSAASAATMDNMVIRAHIINPPNAITDLSAAAVGSNDGDVQLAWTAPSNDNGIAISHYLVRYATYPAVSTATAESWWSGVPATQNLISPAFAPGTQEFATLNGFTVGVTYYFGIKSVDLDGSISPIDVRTGQANQAATQPVFVSGAPSTPTNFVGTAISSTSIVWTWDSVFNAGFYTLNTFPGGGMVDQSTTTSITETGLTANQSVLRTLTAGNGSGLSAPTVVQTRYTLANVPTSVAISSAGFAEVNLTWNANGNASGTTYRIERSVNNLNFVTAGTTTDTKYSDTGLSSLTSYYYRLRAINGDGVTTSTSVTVSTMTMLQVDFIAPNSPLGLNAQIDSSHRVFTLSWDPVTTNVDGTVITDLAGYNIYRKTTLTGAPIKLNPTPLSVTAYADQVNGQTFYYSVRAEDTSGNESDEIFVADSSVAANIIFVGSDGRTSVVIPSEVSDILRQQFNLTGESIRMALVEEAVPNNTPIVRNINIQLFEGHSNNEIKTVAFDKPLVQVNVGYNLVGNQVGIGAPLSVSSAPVDSSNVTNATPQQLSLYWNNGVSWIKIGGSLDEAAQVMATNSSFVGRFQLRVAQAATSVTLNQANVYPRTFTPNGDSLNDRVYFVVENPNNADVTGEIFDMKGRKVATLPAPTTGGFGSTLIWDGKDTTGATVPSGVYQYRIKGEGKTFTGTVVVAR